MGNWSRRKFVQGAVIAPFAARTLWSQAQVPGESYIMFAGTQTLAPATSQGIYAFGWDPKLGALTPLGLAAKSPNPTFLALSPDKKTLIAANEIDNFAGPGASPGMKTGAVSSFKVSGHSLRFVNSVAAQGSGTCHVAIDQSGLAALAANYNGGSAASFRLGMDGTLSNAVSQFHYQGHGPDPERQEAPHAHRVTVSPENRFVFVNDLGLDCLHIYHLGWASATLTPAEPPQWPSTPGSGPRALGFHPVAPFVYCVNELASTIDVLGWTPATGALAQVQKLELLPEGNKAVARASELVFDRTGTFGYAAVRDANFLVTVAVNPTTGKLTLMDRNDCGVKNPRHIALDPTGTWLLVANQDSDTISAIPRDSKSGKLAPSGINTALSKPQCLLFA